MKRNRGGFWVLKGSMGQKWLAAAVSAMLALGMASSSLAVHETDIATQPTEQPTEINKPAVDGEVRMAGQYENVTDPLGGQGGSTPCCGDTVVQLGVAGMDMGPFTGYVRLESGTAVADWSKGYWRNARNRLRSSPFAEGESTWYVDGATATNGWDLVFGTKPGRNPIDWYRKNQIIDGARNPEGYPGDIMILALSAATGHAAFVTERGCWNGRRAWTVRHADWIDPDHIGQQWVESLGDVRVYQCTFAEYRPGKVKVVRYNPARKREVLAGAGYRLLGFIGGQ